MKSFRFLSILLVVNKIAFKGFRISYKHSERTLEFLIWKYYGVACVLTDNEEYYLDRLDYLRDLRSRWSKAKGAAVFTNRLTEDISSTMTFKSGKQFVVSRF